MRHLLAGIGKKGVDHARPFPPEEPPPFGVHVDEHRFRLLHKGDKQPLLDLLVEGSMNHAVTQVDEKSQILL
jgi:hypothetical protein